MNTQGICVDWLPIGELRKLLNKHDFINGILAYCPLENEFVYITDASIVDDGIIGYYGVGRENYYKLDNENIFSHFAILEINEPE